MAVVVRAKPGESPHKLISRFMKKVAEEKIIEDYRERMHYKKPSEFRKEAKYKLLRKFERERKRSGKFFK